MGQEAAIRGDVGLDSKVGTFRQLRIVHGFRLRFGGGPKGFTLVRGKGGDDLVMSSAGPDVLNGGNGDDIMQGKESSDVVGHAER